MGRAEGFRLQAGFGVHLQRGVPGHTQRGVPVHTQRGVPGHKSYTLKYLRKLARPQVVQPQPF